ncbi:MAG TPA: helix-turn-helix domain-containing protein [Candidatus Nanoarchaeia archaeon]|nr:helix-turn-helix domain-containing protein [Candidatus Nanoarchaeia archaeon]
MNELIESLEKFGLSKKESEAYLACLELGDSLASEISLKANLPRTLVYDILERLIDLGLISYAIKTNKKFFRAADPKELIRILKEKQESINKVMSQLEKLHKLKGIKRPKVEIFEGKEGMKTVMNNILRSKVKEFLAYGSSRSSFEVIPAFMEEWHKKRIKQKVVMKILYNNTQQARNKVETRTESLKLTEYKFMPIELESPTATLIYGNKVVLQSWTKEPFAVMIEDEEMAENQKRYFEELWRLAK